MSIKRYYALHKRWNENETEGKRCKKYMEIDGSARHHYKKLKRSNKDKSFVMLKFRRLHSIN